MKSSIYEEDNQTAEDCEFDDKLMGFIIDTKHRNGIVTEKDLREFLDSLTQSN